MAERRDGSGSGNRINAIFVNITDIVLLGRSSFWRDVCEVGYSWKSRFDRHVSSAKHQEQLMLFETFSKPSSSLPCSGSPPDESNSENFLSNISGKCGVLVYSSILCLWLSPHPVSPY